MNGLSDWWLRALAHVHGHMGWLAVAALAHPAWLLRNPKRKTHFGTLFSTLLITLSFVFGSLLYPAYRRLIKHDLFVSNPAIGWWFERKEHLAFGAMILAWIGLITHYAGNRAGANSTLITRASTSETPSLSDSATERDVTVMRRLQRVSWFAYVGAFLLATMVGIVGIAVVAERAFLPPQQPL